MITALSTILVLGILVFVHELGHFLAAKWSGMRVDRFSIGYPPRVIGKKIGDTDYCISAVPFGGYVKIAGMIDESMDKKQIEGEPQPWEFRSKPWFNRFVVIFAGSFMNILLAYFVFAGLIAYDGVPNPIASVGEVLPGTPAAMAGLMKGDDILKINDTPVETWDEMTQLIRGEAGNILDLQCRRGDSLYSVQVVPASDTIVTIDGTKKAVGLIGIQIPLRGARIDEIFILGGKQLVFWSKMIIRFVYQLIAGQESVKNVGGIFTIAQMAGESAKMGAQSLLIFLALLSVNLGILNLLPIPVLDGGHLLILSIEGILRRELPIKAKMAIQQIGMVLLMMLMIVVIYNDVLRVFFHK